MKDVLSTKNIAKNYIIYYVLLNVSITRTLRTLPELYEHKSNVKMSWQILKTVINKKKSSPVCTKFKCNDAIIIDKK